MLCRVDPLVVAELHHTSFPLVTGSSLSRDEEEEVFITKRQLERQEQRPLYSTCTLVRRYRVEPGMQQMQVD